MEAVRDLNYGHLRYFWAVAHDGNLTRTAHRLNVSQSALSVQLKKLEEQLGHTLFERRSRRLHLTEAGRIALDHADAIFSAGDELVATLDRHDTEARRVLHVGAQATLSRNFQLQLLRPIMTRGDVDVIIQSGAFNDLLEHLEALQLDVVLANSAPAMDRTSAIVVHLIDDQAVSLIGHRDRPRRRWRLPRLLTEEPLVLPAGGSGIRRGFDALVSRLGIVPNIVAQVDDMAMLRLVARENIGLAVVPPIVVKDELASGELVEVAKLPELSETFYAMTLDRRFPNPVVKTLLESASFGHKRSGRSSAEPRPKT